MDPMIYVTADASGAAGAASRGEIIIIVDIIDMSTSLEAALDEGAIAIYGASPDSASPQVAVNPALIGNLAGRFAALHKTSIILIAEPRIGTSQNRISRIQKILRGISETGVRIDAILPNLGAETVALADFQGRVAVAVTSSGGVAFDAALTAGAPIVLTGTVAQTRKKKGFFSAQAVVKKALDHARALKKNIAIVAASGNSIEDLLAAEYIFNLMLKAIRK